MRKKSISTSKNGLDWILFYQIQERQKARNRLSKIADGRVQNREIYFYKQLLLELGMQRLR